MDWIATNIRFPQDDYIKLKILSAKRRVSLSFLVRQAVKKIVLGEGKISEKHVFEKLDKVAKIIGKKTGKDWNSIKALREVRYQ